MTSIYPQIAKKVVVLPHDIGYIAKLKNTTIRKGNKIAFIGRVNHEIKGKKVAKMIVKACPEKEFVFVGTEKLEMGIFKKNVKFAGRYQREELVGMINENNVGYVIFPSVCPETFSYLISELMPTGLPIVAFNIGAQAEKLRKYENGVLVEDAEELIAWVKNETSNTQKNG